MQFGSISSPAWQTLTTAGSMLFLHPCECGPHTSAVPQNSHDCQQRKQTGLSSTSRLVFPAPQANVGVSLIMLEMTSNVHTALLTRKQCGIWCKSMCSRTHFPSPVSPSGKTLPQPRARRGGTDPASRLERGRASRRAAPAAVRATRPPDPPSTTTPRPAGRRPPRGGAAHPLAGEGCPPPLLRPPALPPPNAVWTASPLLACLNTEPPGEESGL